MVRGIRGATTVEENNADEILTATLRLFKEMEAANTYRPDDISHVLITVTEDLNAAFPAGALRKLEGYDLVPVMCAREIPVPGSLEKCIRVMMTVNTEKRPEEIKHIYLEKAVTLRPDLSLTKNANIR
ncbi:chorismate mutase [Evansella sp. LMS18]|jgi:chorismate mutase|uniref:chorismate mutase n=1 Tax=Evansella sp. LMS18 TaxID=2924033 RepID=UPI0020D0C3AB|nr:chorismate mutase [Evansella sp. LMS18]UTR13025.1 chorismate mutase [Evansella sp. LMS18]